MVALRTHPPTPKSGSTPAPSSSETPNKKRRRSTTPAAVGGSPLVKLGGVAKPLPLQIRTPIERSFKADMSHVRVHDDALAHKASRAVGARAFTYGSNIYLNSGENATNLPLMAHEAAHTIQQQSAPTVQMFPTGTAHNSHEAEAHHAAQAVLSGQSFTVMNRTGGNTIQRLLSIVGEKLNSYARHIPGYTLFTVIIKFNPLTGQSVTRTPMNLLEGLMGLVPFGTVIFDTLRERGILQDAFNWVQGELERFDLSLARIERTIEAAWEDMTLAYGFDHNLGVLERHFGVLYRDVRGFATSLVDHIVQLITEAAIGVVEDMLADNKAWALIKKILHHDPLRNKPVEATTVEILGDFLMLIGREQELAQMRERGTLQETADWLDTQIGTFMSLLDELGGLFSDAWEAIQPKNLSNLQDNLGGLVTRAGNFLQRVWNFATTVAIKVLELIKDALLSWLKSFASDVPGYHLLTVLLGRDVFTQKEVPRTPINLIRGFMSLIPGGEQQFQQMSETGVIPQAAQRIETLISELGISWEFVQNLFIGLWNSLSIDDLIDPIGAFERIVARFGEPISRLFTFVIEVIKVIIKLVLVMMNFPSELIGNIITNAMQAFEDIQRDPVGFLINLLRTVKAGFTRFFDNFLTHLLNGLVGWLFGQLRGAGVEPPADLSLASLLDFTLGVLGITIENIWSKLAERIGQENVDRIRGAVEMLTGIWTFIQDVQERGVAAIWERIESQISNLWDIILNQVTNFVMERIVNRVVARLLSMLDPTGIMAVVNGFIAFFNAVQSAIEYLREMLEIVNDFVSTVAAVARGDVNPGAERMEQGLAASLPVAIGFLANQVGLGRIGDQIVHVIQSVRQMIDRALNWLIDKALQVGGVVFDALKAGVKAVINWWKERRTIKSGKKKYNVYFEGGQANAKLYVSSSPGVSYKIYLENIKSQMKTDKQKQAHKKADEAGKRIDKNLASRKKTTAETNALVKDLESWADLLRTMLGTAKSPPSVIKYGNVNAKQGGAWAKAEILSQDSGGSTGTEPQDSPPIWSAVQKRKNDNNDRAYVQGHLLNHNVQGPGKRFNMTPITYKANDDHKRGIEAEIKKRVLDDDEVVYYKVEAKYDGHPKSADYKELEVIEPANRTAEQRWQLEVMEADLALASRLEFDAHTLNQDADGKWKKDKAIVHPAVQNVIPTKKPDSSGQVAVKQLVRLSINNAGSSEAEKKEALLKLPQMGSRRADVLVGKLKSGKVYHNWAEIIADNKGITEALVNRWQGEVNADNERLVYLDGETKWKNG